MGLHIEIRIVDERAEVKIEGTRVQSYFERAIELTGREAAAVFGGCPGMYFAGAPMVCRQCVADQRCADCWAMAWQGEELIEDQKG